MAANLRLLIADDHYLVRRGVRAYLEEQPGWEVVAEVSNGKDAVDMAKLSRPDVAILDLRMPELNGLEAAREILKNVPTKVLILTMYDCDDLVREGLDIGVQGYVLKSDAGRDLVSAVKKLSHNKKFFTPKVAQMILDGHFESSKGNRDNTTRKNGALLTARQRQILRLLMEGKSSTEIAATLSISAKTAETHRANIMRRLDCHSTVELVRYGIRNEINPLS